jgi:ATP-dependent helicase HrpB
MRQDWLRGQGVLMLEPRRLAARTSAARMAYLLGESVGETVGYRIRFDNRISERTRIEVVTEGILTRRLQSDPELAGVGLVIFDEFHERSLHADLAMALCLDVAQGLRSDLRLLAMSATMDTQAVSNLLGGAAIVEAVGRSHPVRVDYVPDLAHGPIAESLTSGIVRALREQSGDVLAFLPGAGEIRAVAGKLTRLASQEPFLICPLYGDLDRADQERAILPDPEGRRRVVLATSIAETSLTIEGVTTVVDSGWSRVPRFDPNTGLTRLDTVRVSRAAAEQRAGRAGRLGPGVCYRLWGDSVHEGLRPASVPEILEADLAPLLLELAAWGVTRPEVLRWLDPPPPGALAQARDLLKKLSAIDGQGQITATGRRMAAMPLHPRLAHMLLRCRTGGQLALACDLAALLTERDILRARPGAFRPSDLESRLVLLTHYRERGEKTSPGITGDLDPHACRQVLRAARQYRRQLAGAISNTGDGLTPGALLALAYPDRVARRRPGQPACYLLASGREVRLREDDPLIGEEFLVAAHLDAGRKEGRVYLAAGVSERELRSVLSDQIGQVSEVAWDQRTKAVVARREERLGAVVLSRQMLADADPQAAVEAMLTGIRKMGIACLPWSRAARDWQARVLSLRHWQPAADWPDLSDATLLAKLSEFLGPYLSGITRREQLGNLDLSGILRNRTDWDRQQRVEILAPTHIHVPSGMRKRLLYTPGQPPVLAVRLQEMFGLRDTPRICNGQEPVLLHLLSPAQRPIQVTQDLAGFWERTYAQVRKELKGRYPKHYWPDDPRQAQPTAGTRPR